MTSVQSRLRRSLIPQLGYLLSVVTVAIFGLIVEDAAETIAFWAGVGGIAATTAIFVVVVRAGWADSAWCGLVPIADVALFPLVRSGMGPLAVAAPSLILVLPLAWGAFAFSKWVATTVGVLAAGGGMVLALMDAGESAEADELARLILPPVMIGIIVAGSYLTGRQVRSGEEMLGTATIRLRESLHTSSEHKATLQAVLDAAHGPIIVLDAGEHPVVLNTAAWTMLTLAGFESTRRGPELIDDALICTVDRITPVTIPPGRTGLAVFFSDEIGDGRTVWVGAPGSQRAFSFTWREVRSDEGQALGRVVVGADITTLADAIRVRDMFLSTVGHELRTPLTPLLAYAELLQDDDATRRVGEQIDRSAQRLKTVVDHLITATRDSIRSTVPDTHTATQLARVDQLFTDRARACKIDLAVVDDVDCPIRFDPRDLEQVLDALIDNAFRYVAPGGSITIHARKDDVPDRVVIDVADTGPGMSDDERRQAFDSFYRAPAAITGAVPGVGLGLTIAHNLARSNHATITLASTTPVGLIATLSIHRTPPTLHEGA